MISYVRSRGLHAVAAIAPMTPRPFLYCRMQPSPAADWSASVFSTIPLTARQYMRTAGCLCKTTNPGFVVSSSRQDHRSTRRPTTASTRPGFAGSSPRGYARTSVVSMRPMDRGTPRPRPTRRQIAPFPRVFHGMFGLSLTRRGYPMRSYSFVSSRTISVARNVVHMPRRLSVSSTPIHKTMRPLRTRTATKTRPRDNLHIGSTPRRGGNADQDLRTLERRRPALRQAIRPVGQPAGGPQQHRHPRLRAGRATGVGGLPLHRELPCVGGGGRAHPDRGEPPLGRGREGARERLVVWRPDAARGRAGDPHDHHDELHPRGSHSRTGVALATADSDPPGEHPTDPGETVQGPLARDRLIT